MIKLAAARQALLDAPLGIKAAKLLTFAEGGTVRSWRGESNQSFLLDYTAHFIVTDYAGAPQDLFYVLLQWLHAENPDAPEDAIRFHVDIISAKAADVSLKVELSEVVAATEVTAGLKLTPTPDPDTKALDMGSFAPGLPDSAPDPE